jgi:Fic family protein
MNLIPVGNLWLRERFGLKKHRFTHQSYVGNNEKIELNQQGDVNQIYGKKYAPEENTPLAHIVFSLKYDDLDLSFLKAVFTQIGTAEIIDFIGQSPSGKYTRKIGFLYEFLTRLSLDLPYQISGNYTDLLDEDEYITGRILKDNRWRINNNLLGTVSFCPVVRRTPVLDQLLKKDIEVQIEQLKQQYSPDIFRRATNYLYSKETRSSYEIEKEKPSPERMNRFIALLMKAGKESSEQMLDEGSLTTLQNSIVDPRFAAPGFRDFQNYIGQSLPYGDEIIHYICPPPQYLISLMDGLKAVADKTEGGYAVVRATLISFGFVFIHPFEDGNGRLHRFLIHDMLVRDGIVPDGLIIPVSAHMLNHIHDYDQVLENYSKPLLHLINYTKKGNGEMEVTNPAEVEGYFRYPDLTTQCIFLAQTIQETISQDIPEELAFIQHYDELKSELQNIVDMPDKDINLMILFLHQNKGAFPNRRRKDFSKLTESEITAMEAAYRTIFQDNIDQKTN